MIRGILLCLSLSFCGPTWLLLVIFGLYTVPSSYLVCMLIGRSTVRWHLCLPTLYIDPLNSDPHCGIVFHKHMLFKEVICLVFRGTFNKFTVTLFTRFWLARAVESYLRGNTSYCDQVFLMRRGLLQVCKENTEYYVIVSMSVWKNICIVRLWQVMLTFWRWVG